MMIIIIIINNSNIQSRYKTFAPLWRTPCVCCYWTERTVLCSNSMWMGEWKKCSHACRSGRIHSLQSRSQTFLQRLKHNQPTNRPCYVQRVAAGTSPLILLTPSLDFVVNSFLLRFVLLFDETAIPRRHFPAWGARRSRFLGPLIITGDCSREFPRLLFAFCLSSPHWHTWEPAATPLFLNYCEHQSQLFFFAFHPFRFV